MSDSSSAPVAESSRNVAAPSTRSWSGRSRKPIVDRPSVSSGWLRVKPCALKVTGRAGSASQVAAARPTASAKACGAHAGDIALGDEVADRPGGPAHRHHLSADLDAELQIGMSGRRRAATTAATSRTATVLAQARGHGRSFTARTSAPNAASGRTARPGSPRPTRAGVATARTGVGTTTSVPDRGSGRDAIDAQRQVRPARASPAPGRAGTPPPHRRAERRRPGDDQRAAAGFAAGHAKRRRRRWPCP